MSNLNNILFCILSRSSCEYYDRLSRFLKNKNIDTFILKDNEHYTNTKELSSIGFKNLNNISIRFGEVIAWDKIFYHIYTNNLLNTYRYFYIIEDDVYSQNIDYFYNLILDWQNYDSDFITKKVISKKDSPYWYYWKYYKSLLFDNPYKSLNPLCRLSSGLTKRIIDYALAHNTFIFQEILFASLCIQYNLSIIEYDIFKNKNDYIGDVVWNSKLVKQSKKIYHPEKNICII